MKFYSVQLKKSVDIEDNDLEIVTMKNGRKAAKATISEDGQDIKLFRILSKVEAEQLV